MPELAKAVGATEEPETYNPMKWVGLMNNRKTPPTAWAVDGGQPRSLNSAHFDGTFYPLLQFVQLIVPCHLFCGKAGRFCAVPLNQALSCLRKNTRP